MSAFVVDRAHIDLLVAVALDGPRGVVVRPDRAWSRPFSWYWSTISADLGVRYTLDETNADDVGRMLLAENVRSVSVRYRGEYPLPGPCDVPETETGECAGYAHTRRAYRLTAVEALMALRCYEYQACESSDWKASQAYAFCDALRAHLVACLPGMDDAPWEWTDERIRQHACLHTRRLIAGTLDTCADCGVTGLA